MKLNKTRAGKTLATGLILAALCALQPTPTQAAWHGPISVVACDQEYDGPSPKGNYSFDDTQLLNTDTVYTGLSTFDTSDGENFGSTSVLGVIVEDNYWYWTNDSPGETNPAVGDPVDFSQHTTVTSGSNDGGSRTGNAPVLTDEIDFDNVTPAPYLSGGAYRAEKYSIANSLDPNDTLSVKVQYGPLPTGATGIPTGDQYYVRIQGNGLAWCQESTAQAYTDPIVTHYFGSTIAIVTKHTEMTVPHGPTVAFPAFTSPPTPDPTPRDADGNPIIDPRATSAMPTATQSYNGWMRASDGTQLTSGVTWSVTGDASKVTTHTETDDSFTVTRATGDTSEGTVYVNSKYVDANGYNIYRTQKVRLKGTLDWQVFRTGTSSDNHVGLDSYLLIEPTVDGDPVYNGYTGTCTWDVGHLSDPYDYLDYLTGYESPDGEAFAWVHESNYTSGEFTFVGHVVHNGIPYTTDEFDVYGTT